MFILLSITLLVLASLAMLILRIWRPNFGYQWLIAAGSTFIAWLLVLLSLSIIPESLQIASWGPRTTYPNSIILTLDRISWPITAAVGTLLIATMLSDVVRAHDLSWSNWASSLFVTALGIVGISSGNLLTFFITWTAFDLTVLVILLLQLESENLRRKAVLIFFIHLLGTACLLVAGVISVSENNAVLLEQGSPRAILFVILAALIRFGALPFASNMLEDPNNRRSFGTIRSLVSMAIVTALLVRVAAALENVSFPGILWLGITSMLGIIALLYSFAWFFSRDEIEGRQAWIMTFGVLVIGSALRAEVNSSLSWALAVIFSGGMIFLASVRDKISVWITMIGLLGICAIPFTPAWAGLGVFSAPYNISHLLYFVALLFMISGYTRHATWIIPGPPGLERWIKVVYPLGLILLPLTHIGLGWIYKPGTGTIPISSWIIGPLLVISAAIGFLLWQRAGEKTPQGLINIVTSMLTFSWLGSIIQSLFGYLARIMNFTSRILEGEGGLLWVLLSIVLFLAILVISIGS
jgi:hypothetical protein